MSINSRKIAARETRVLSHKAGLQIGMERKNQRAEQRALAPGVYM